jgi:ferredoxin-NADP reductase
VQLPRILFAFNLPLQYLFAQMKVLPSLLLLVGAPCSSVNAFSPSLSLSQPGPLSKFSTALHAEGGGAVQYDKRNAVLKEAEIVGEGTVILHIDRVEGDEVPLEYEPGHVLALEIEGDPDAEDLNEKTVKDMKNNNGWMRGPYTVTRCNGKSMDIVLKVVGAKSRAFATAEPGTPLKFGGKFHVPIAEGIAPNTERIVMLSTGVGVGPCVGAVEKLLSENFAGSIDLFASFRQESEMIFADYLNVWSTAYEGFRYKPIITSEVGRLSSSEENVGLVINEDICSLTETHYHLIGNGQMVKEWKAGLTKAGVPKERITIENYFNTFAEPSAEAIDRIASVVRDAALNQVN